MKLLIASDPYGKEEAILEQLISADVKTDEVTCVNSAKAVLDAIKADCYDCIITEYNVGDTDIWRLSTLVHSSCFSLYACPIILIKETCQIEIPAILAKEYSFLVVPINELEKKLIESQSCKEAAGYNDIKSTRNSLLIIEDDKDSSLTAYHALKDIYEIEMASDGLSGLALWEKKRHDLVLLDLMLPKMCGEQILNKMMAINKNQSVIIVTALDKHSIQNKLLLNGASEYLCKPFSVADLRVLCQVLLNKSKLLHQAQYSVAKMNAMRNLVWLLDYALVKNESEKAKTIMASLKEIVPNNLTEDEKISLLTQEF